MAEEKQEKQIWVPTAAPHGDSQSSFFGTKNAKTRVAAIGS